MTTIENNYTDIYKIFERFLDQVSDPVLTPSFEMGELEGMREVVTYIRQEDTVERKQMTEEDIEVYLFNIQRKLLNFLRVGLSGEFQNFVLEEELDDELMRLYPKLDTVQESVLVLGMVNEWIRSKISDSNMMRPAIHDRNYQESSHSAQMGEMRNQIKENTRDMRRMVNNHQLNRVRVNARG